MSIVEKLRYEARLRATENFEIFSSASAMTKTRVKPFEEHLADDLCQEAADEIERLQRELSTARRTALLEQERIAERIIQSVCEIQELPDLDHPETIVINVDDLRAIIENNLDRAERAIAKAESDQCAS